jgi:5,10-methylenetetrahydrofolate reductase
MFIKELFSQKCFTLSFEFFPPEREGNLDSLFATIQETSTLKPDFISVTYGAGGSTRKDPLRSPHGKKRNSKRKSWPSDVCPVYER